MIDTTKIKNHWNAMASGTVVYLDVERDTVFKLCDHIDELERKLKIAEDALEKVNEDTVFIIALHAAREALKQIRDKNNF